MIICGGLLLSAVGCRKVPPPAPVAVPVLMYHHVAADPGADVWTVSPEEFRGQMAQLKAAGFTSILPADLVAAGRGKKLPAKPVLITFDDGLHSVKEVAEPVLRALGFRAVVYLITGFIAETPATRMSYKDYACLTWPEVRELADGNTMVFGIHSHTHSQSPARVAQEVAAARALFQEKTGRAAGDFCYPYGVAPDFLAQAVSNAGYQTAMICEDRVFWAGTGADLFHIPRVSIYGGHHDFQVGAILAATNAVLCASVQNRGVPLPVAAGYRAGNAAGFWQYRPATRLGPQVQNWCWSNVPPGAGLVEIWEQNLLFRYYP